MLWVLDFSSIREYAGRSVAWKVADGGSGKYLAQSGPVSMLIGYALVGVLCYSVMAGLGEMAAWLPIASGFTGFANRFVDPALGFALGWNYWFTVSSSLLSSEITLTRY